MIPITETLALDERELTVRFIRASGPGGQHVNKVSTAVQLRFDLAGSRSLPSEVRSRAMRLAGNRLTSQGVLLIEASRFRSQERNRQDAVQRLVELLARAAEAPRARKPTRPSASAKRRRLETKRRRSDVKRRRGDASRDRGD